MALAVEVVCGGFSMLRGYQCNQNRRRNFLRVSLVRDQMEQLSVKKVQIDHLLQCCLPASIVKRLRESEEVSNFELSEKFENVSCIFLDIERIEGTKMSCPFDALENEAYDSKFQHEFENIVHKMNGKLVIYIFLTCILKILII